MAAGRGILPERRLEQQSGVSY